MKLSARVVASLLGRGALRPLRKGASFTAKVVLGASVIGVVGAGCLSRPVVHSEPTTKTNFTADVKQSAVDKVDLLFAIDNSASMGDKQDLLKEAVPDLIGRLVTPNCVDESGATVMAAGKAVTVTVNANGVATCATGKPEFQPVHDMHIGIVSSALGGRGGDQCDPNAMNPVTMTLNRHNDDHGHLLNRATADEHPLADAGTSNYLAWFPAFDKNIGKPDPSGAPKIVGPDPTQLVKDFQDLVSGVHEYGCGLENQMESWYHFLIQPDPYQQIIVDPKDDKMRRRIYDGIDKDILVQRKDFLRPDSLVAIILLSDEEDSGMDPLAVGGQGWAYVNSKFPGSCGGGPARGTSACDKPETITTADCTSCGFSGHESDPNCQKVGDTCSDPANPGVQKPQAGYYTATEDVLNTRSIRMKQRYGVDPQYPIRRYTDGLGGASSSQKILNVPSSFPALDKNGAPIAGTGEHAANGTYLLENKNCRNPLFAKNLPVDGTADQLCNLDPGPRTRDLVFFAAITGVPWQLLTEKSDDPASKFKTSFSTSDWKKIIGNDPNKYDFTGIDPHMYEAIKPNEGPRAGLAASTTGDTTDPFHGREWESASVDLQYACTFALPGEKDCADPKLASACDCGPGKNPPLCAPGDPAMARKQVRGKAYPGIRQLTVARDLGDQGIVASLCARESKDKNNADYGYRPAVRALVDRLKNALANQCVPQELTASNCGDFPCLILETLGIAGPQSDCAKYPGLSDPPTLVLKKFRENQKAQQGAIGPDAGAGVDQSQFPVCLVQQLVPTTSNPGGATCDGTAKGCAGTAAAACYADDFKQDKAGAGSCAASSQPGWCYLKGAAAGSCPQAILFSPTGNPQVGAKVNLVCIEASGGGTGDDAGK